jgi:plastocyanin domain-containing protein
MKSTNTVMAIIFAGVLIGGAVFLSGGSSAPKPIEKNPVSVVDGKQIIDISAKGGYLPREVAAKAGIPTVLRVATNGTFDCSSALTIPAIGYRNNLPQTGTTDIDIPPQEVGATVQGICAMGMYNFALKFN